MLHIGHPGDERGRLSWKPGRHFHGVTTFRVSYSQFLNREEICQDPKTACRVANGTLTKLYEPVGVLERSTVDLQE